MQEFFPYKAKTQFVVFIGSMDPVDEGDFPGASPYTLSITFSHFPHHNCLPQQPDFLIVVDPSVTFAFSPTGIFDA
jgi:hypothetical protein